MVAVSILKIQLYYQFLLFKVKNDPKQYTLPSSTSKETENYFLSMYLAVQSATQSK